MPTFNLFISNKNINEQKLSLSKEYSLSNDDIIIYALYLPNFNELTNDLINFLTPDERNRAKRYYKEKDQNRFIICRSILKFVLAAQTKLDVTTIYLDYHPNKKPYLASHPLLHFNISHSEDFAVIAISRNMVGIDIEYVSENFDFIPLLPDIFNDNEISSIQKAVNKKTAFYTSWTRKEAFVKGLGKGIDEDFKKIPCLEGLHCIDSILLKTSEKWQVYSFDLADCYIGAIAFESLSTISKNLVMFTMPNTMKELLEMAQTRNN
ncbi:4'-phosphopantetheinyl transferase superfamily protein [Flavobacterium franklandianum]|uniref:4'-phosphopantetheinyl transferase superfamily protein n=1 Tax=Flavobacterium franklandianum TaxID=2594430 RepID=A0A553CRF9_9FLAO|nr:4'-phosphopantetheinyl transferase superfamily protein [Flavobacterium franklandianum]TRX22984.1 4'-phosphopantetheinyl transferase superfamily protein [Flavobacterium franklandianum]TRX27552.1 4'-phosphopantetheinyl transferase superfamily protein [Flavobacterium franklandianum]